MAITLLNTYRVLYYDKSGQRIGGDYSIPTREEAVQKAEAWRAAGGKAFGEREIDLGLIPVCDFAPTEREREEQAEKDTDTLFRSEE